MKKSRLLMLSFGICVLNAGAHPGAPGHSHADGNPWYLCPPAHPGALSVQEPLSHPLPMAPAEGRKISLKSKTHRRSVAGSKKKTVSPFNKFKVLIGSTNR